MIQHAVEAFSLFLKKFEPNTVYTPGAMFHEFEKLPGIVLSGPVIAENRQQDYSKRPEFSRLNQKQCMKRSGPRHYDLDFTITVLSVRQRVLIQYVTELLALFESTRELAFPREAPEYSCHMRMAQEFKIIPGTDLAGVGQAQAVVRIESVPLVSRSEQSIPAIEKFVFEYTIKKGDEETWVLGSRTSS